MHSRVILALTGVLVAALLGPAVLSAGPVEKDTLKIGAIFSITGRAQTLGIPEKNTAEMMVEQINGSGGVNGFLIKLVLVDDESLPSNAKGAADKLVQEDKVLAVIGPSTSGNTLDVRPITEAAKVPLVSCASAETIVSPAESFPYTFKVAQHDTHVATRILEKIASMGHTKIGLMFEKSAFGEEGGAKIRQLAPKFGVKVVAEESFTVKETRMTPHISRLVDAGSQALVVWAVAPVLTIIPKNAKEMGLSIPLFLNHSFGNPAYIEHAGGAAEGILFPSGRILVADSLPVGHFQREALLNYKQSYEKRFGPATTFGGHTYDAMSLVVNAIRAKSITPGMNLETARRLVRDGIEETTLWIGIAGQFTMAKHDHTGLDKDRSLEMLTIRNGKVVPVDPSLAGK